jgi:RNA polymerase sigma-70 factor (ECF subfamily)
MIGGGRRGADPIVTPAAAAAGAGLVQAGERARLVRLCLQLTGDVDAAEDLAQETLYEAWRHLHAVHDPRGLDRWLSAIARNVCRRWAQRRGRELARRSPPAAGGTETGPSLDDLPADDFDVEAELERRELVELLDRALGLLPPETRASLIHRYVEDAPIGEVAARLGLTEGAVAMRLQRGKLTLRRLLGTVFARTAVAYGLIDATDGTWQETRIWCPRCGARRLLGCLDHPRIRRLPPREVEVDGSAARVTGYESVTGHARLDVVATRDTCRLIAIHRSP